MDNKTAKAMYEAAKQFVEAYEYEERKPDIEKQKAYGKLLDCVIGRMSYETICDAAIALAEACEAKRDKPKAGEVYRDIFGNRYVVIVGVHDDEPVKKSFVMLGHIDGKGDLLLTGCYTLTLEDFLNPKLTKE